MQTLSQLEATRTGKETRATRLEKFNAILLWTAVGCGMCIAFLGMISPLGQGVGLLVTVGCAAAAQMCKVEQLAIQADIFQLGKVIAAQKAAASAAPAPDAPAPPLTPSFDAAISQVIDAGTAEKIQVRAPLQLRPRRLELGEG